MADFNQKDQKGDTQANIDEMEGDAGRVGGDKISVGASKDSIIAAGAGARVTVHKGLTAEEVATLVVALKQKDQPQVWDGRIPYLGLKVFQESDAEFFFGREELVKDLLQPSCFPCALISSLTAPYIPNCGRR